MNKNILITGGRFPSALDLIRNLSKSGNKVMVAETTLMHYCSTSKANAKNILIESPRGNEEKYIDKLIKIIQTEKIDLLIPTWEEALVISKYLDKFPKDVPFTSDFSLVHSLHNKWEFFHLVKKLGFNTPATMQITKEEDLKSIPYSSFYLKYSYSRGSNGTIHVKKGESLPKVELCSGNSVLAQEELKGRPYCTYSICHKGEVKAHATYPVHYERLAPTISRGRYCFSFEQVYHDKILATIVDFVKKTGYTGSLSFDIFDEAGEIYFLECNPRITSGLTLLTSHQTLDRAFFNCNEPMLQPMEGEKKQMLCPALFFGTKSAIQNGSFIPYLKTLLTTADLIFSLKDLKPFFFQPFIGMYQIILKHRHKKGATSAFSHDLDFEG